MPNSKRVAKHDDVSQRRKMHAEDRCAHYARGKIAEVDCDVRSKRRVFGNREWDKPSQACPKWELEVWEDEAGEYQILGIASHVLDEAEERIDIEFDKTKKKASRGLS